MAPPIIRTGRLLLKEGHASTEVLLSREWLMEDGFSKFVLWVWSTRGGSLTYYQIPDQGTIRDRIPVKTHVVAPDDLTALAIGDRIKRGCVSFTPADILSGTTWVDFDSSF